MSGSKQEYSGDAEGRLSIHEVPEKISRIFFGDPKPSYNAPGGTYGAPPVGGVGYYPPGGSQFLPYPGYFDDLQLTMTLGQAALIVFIIFAIVAILFMLVMLCLYCASFRGSSNDAAGITPRSVNPAKAPYVNAQGIDSSVKPAPPARPRTPTVSTSSSLIPAPLPGSLTRRPGTDRLDRQTSSSSTASSSATSTPTQTHVKQRPSYIFSDIDTRPTRPPAPTPEGKSTSTGDTAVSRRLPSLPRSGQDSQTTTSESLSEPRSVPYYEIPTPRPPYTTMEATLLRSPTPKTSREEKRTKSLSSTSRRDRKQPFTYLREEEAIISKSRLV